MSIAQLSSTTLNTTGGIDARQTRFVLTSTSNIYGVGSLVAGQGQSVLVIDDEKMLVQSIPISGTVEVIRGVDGSKAKPHANSSTVWFGSKDKFGAATEGGYVCLIGTGGTPDGILPTYGVPGTRRAVAGKEYVMCNFDTTVHTGVTVSISNDGNYTAKIGRAHV